MKITFSDQSITNRITPLSSNRSQDFQRWGAQNCEPTFLAEAVANSPVQSAILDNMVNMICGAGVEWDGTAGQPNDQTSWDALMEQLVQDYSIFNSFALQVIKAKDGMGCYFYYQSPIELRAGRTDEYGNHSTYWISSDWRKFNRKTAVEVKKFTTYEDLKVGEVAVAWFQRKAVGDTFYATPKWKSAINYVIADAKLSSFHVNQIGHGFAPSAVLSFPYNPSEETKKLIQEGIEGEFAGEGNSGNIICLFSENEQHVEIKPFAASANADIYSNSSETILQMICSANRLPHPSLAGLQPKSGFASQADVLKTAYILYKNTVILNARKFILQSVNALMRQCGIDAELSFADMDVVGEIEGNQASIARNDRVEESVTADNGSDNTAGADEINTKTEE